MQDKTRTKIYDKSILQRFFTFLKPYKKLMALAILFLAFTSIFDLAIPYITKTAIDHNIIPHYVEVTQPEQLDSRFMNRTVMLTDGRVLLDISKVSRADKAELEKEGLLGKTRFIIVNKLIKGKAEYFIPTQNNKYAIPENSLKNFNKKEIRILRERDIRAIYIFAAIFLGILVFNFIFTFAQVYTLQYVGQKVMYDMRIKIMEHILHLPLAYFDKNPAGRIVTRPTNDVAAINEMFSSVLVYLLKDIMLLAGILIIMYRMNPRLTLYVVALTPLIVFITVVFRIKVRNAYRIVRKKIAALNAFLQETISGIRIIQIFTLEDTMWKRFLDVNNQLFAANMKQLYIFAVFRPLIEVIRALALAVLIWLGGGEVIRANLSFGALVAFISYIDMFFRPIRDLSEKYNIMQSAMAAGERIFALLDENVEFKGKGLRKQIWGKVEFKNVWFAYNRDEWVLKDISFVVNPGETLAVVGPTGAGKTSLISLIFQFYRHNKGRILIDDIDIEEYDLGYLRSQMALVLQDVFIFSGPVEKNVKLYNEKISEEKVEKAIKYVYAHEFIQKLDEGLKSELGERGTTLSVGERQLLSFARAIAFDPKILVLDEATANVDSHTEYLIQKALKKVLQNRTSIVIAHRLSTIKDADNIIVIYDGIIKESGKHEELIKKRGLYYHLYTLQFAKDIESV